MKKQKVILAFLMVLFMVFFILSGCSRRHRVNSREAVIDDSGSGLRNSRVVTFHVTGKGLAPETAISKGQAELMAERAAVADGYRQLVEKLRGVYVDAYMKAGQGAVNYDMIRTSTQAWLRGAEVDDLVKVDYGITEAHMSLRVNFVKRNMIWWPAGIGQNAVSRSGIIPWLSQITGSSK